MKLSEPIFVVGTGRSGSTVFFDILARHPSVAWLSKLADDYPQRPFLNRLLLGARSVAILDGLIGGRFGPSEAYKFWELQCPGFSNPYRDLHAGDVTPVVADRIRHIVDATVTSSRCRFLAKITGWPRIGFLQDIFPNAYFIEVKRDPRATVSSLLDVAFWDGWRGPPNWRRGPLPPDLDAIWKSEGESFVALAALEYVVVHRAMAICIQNLKQDQFISVLYGQLCSNSTDVFRVVCKSTGLAWSDRFARSIRRTNLVDRDSLWRQRLTTSQQSILVRTLAKANMPVGAP